VTPNRSGTVGGHGGPNGPGNLLASIPCIPDGGSCSGYNADFCPFPPAGELFAGIARSVSFGEAIEIPFDDVTLGANLPSHRAVAPVPLPAGLPLNTAAPGLLGLAGRRPTRAAARGPTERRQFRG
jgi:hypothetical protein